MPSATATTTPAVSSWRRLLAQDRSRTIAAVVGLLVLALVTVLPTALRGLPFSVFDEATHLDLALRDAAFDPPVRGDDIDDEILLAWGCYGSESYIDPACTPDQAVSDYPNRGSQYNFGHPPLYYAITGMLAHGIEAVTSLDFVTAARATGVLWLFAGMTTLMLGIRRLGVDLLLSTALAATAGMWWTTVTASIYVTNDAPALAVAGGVVLLVGSLAKGQVPWIATMLLAVGAASTKVMNGLVVLAFAGVCLLMALVPRWNPNDLRRGRLLLAAGGGVVGVLGVFGAWTLYQSSRGDPDWVSPIHGQSGSDIHGSPIDEWLSTLLDGFTAIGHASTSAPVANQALVIVLAQIASIVVLVTLGVAWLRSTPGTPVRMLAATVALGLLAWPIIVQAQMFRSTSGEDFFASPSGRYGLTVPPLTVAAIALLTPRGGARIAVLVGALVFVLATVIALWLPAI